MTTTRDISSRERLTGLMALMTGDEKHDAAASSVLDVLQVLYERVLDVGPDRADDPDRDRLLLSKGHGPQAFYAVLAAQGFLDETDLTGFGRFGSALGFHPDRHRAPGVEIGSGSLGHGLALGVGSALGLRLTGRRARVVVVLGDAELDEGSNHEAIAVAARFGLDRLAAVVVDNRSDTHGWPGGIAARFAVEGWATRDVAAADHDALAAALVPDDRRPLAVVAHVGEVGHDA